MHGLVNRAVQCFVRDTYGLSIWRSVARRAGLEKPEFEAMLHYEDGVTDAVLKAISTELNLPRTTVLEDLGTYLVSHSNVEALRRLLRFSGVTYLEFLYSLDDLRARARLALSDLDLPALELCDLGGGCYDLICRHRHSGFSYVVMGILRTMADDYGALVLLEHGGQEHGYARIRIQLIEECYSNGRRFELGAKSA